MSKYSKGGFKMTYSKDCDFLSFEKNTDMFRAEQILLCAIKQHNVNLPSWITCVNLQTDDILFFIPSESLRFFKVNHFLECLKKAWIHSGFIIESFVDMDFLIKGTKTIPISTFHLKVSC